MSNFAKFVISKELLLQSLHLPPDIEVHEARMRLSEGLVEFLFEHASLPAAAPDEKYLTVQATWRHRGYERYEFRGFVPYKEEA